MKNKITKSERKYLATIILSILAFAFFSEPLQNFLSKTFGETGDITRVIVGAVVILSLFWIWNIK